MKLHFFLILILFGLLPSTAISQNNRIDSLTKVLNGLKEASTQKIEVLHELNYELESHNLDKAQDYSKRAYDISLHLKDTTNILNSLYNLSKNYYLMDSNSLCLKLAIEQEELGMKSKKLDQALDGLFLQRLIYSRTNNIKMTTIVAMRRLDIATLSTDNLSIARAKLSLGITYYESDEDSIAIIYYKSAIPDFLKSDNYRGIQSVRLNIGNSFRSIGELDSAMIHLQLGLQLALEMDSKSMIHKFYSTLGSVENTKSNYQKAIHYAKKSINFIEKNNIINSQVYIDYNIIGKSYMQLNSLDSALFYLKLAEKELSSTKYPKIQNGLYINLAQLYEKRKEYKQAYHYRTILYHKIDSLYDNSAKDHLLEARAKYELLENENKLVAQKLATTEAKASKNRILFIGTILLLLLASLFGFYLINIKRKNKEAQMAFEKEKEKTENIRKLDKLKDQFFTNISHELRTPLTLISDPLNKVLQKPISDLDHDDIELAHKNSHKLLSLINEIMDLSKLDAGKVKVKTSTISINHSLRRIFLAFDSLANIKNIKLNFVSKIPDDLRMLTDYKKLEKIINNLVSNAIKFSNNGGIITLSASVERSICTVKVQDEGLGISAEDQKQIFNRFYQGEQKSYQGGTGVGLALSKELCTLLGGNLVVESTKNEGSAFTLTLPFEESTSHTINHLGTEVSPLESPQYQSLMIDGEKPKILIVEDNEDMSKYLHKIMSDSYQCTMALNGGEALRAIQTDKFQLILSDVMMPGMDGFQLRRKSIEIFKHESIPYIFLTARSLEDDILQGLRLGVDDYITKPFNSDELKVRVHNLIKNKIERNQWISTDKEGDIRLDDAEDIRFIKDAERFILNHISEPNYNVSSLSNDLAISTRQLGRKIKAFTGLTPVALILEMRLQKARQLLERKTFNNLAEIRYDVGIESASYFTTKYKERFGVSPGELIKKT